MSHSSQMMVETALQPINEILEHIVYRTPKQSKEKDILRIMTLMASIRTRALEHGWSQECESDLSEAQGLLQCLQTAASTI